DPPSHSTNRPEPTPREWQPRSNANETSAHRVPGWDDPVSRMPSTSRAAESARLRPPRRYCQGRWPIGSCARRGPGCTVPPTSLLRRARLPRAYHRGARKVPSRPPSQTESGIMIDGSTRVAFDDVEVVRHAALIVMCRVGEKVVAARPLRMLPGTTISQTGDHGRLVLPRELALNLGLI